MQQPIEELLADGIKILGLSVNSIQQEQLIAYIELLNTWNQTYNLTAIRDRHQMVVKHVLDSLAISQFIDGERVLDVGSGPGIPGVILAITQPQRSFHLLDSNGKKTRFITHAVSHLGLGNVQAIQNRVEQYQYPAKYTTIVSRAFASLSTMVENCKHLLLAKGNDTVQKTPAEASLLYGIFVAMKGMLAEQEVTEFVNTSGGSSSPDFGVDVHALRVPFLDEARHAVVIRQHN